LASDPELLCRAAFRRGKRTGSSTATRLSRACGKKFPEIYFQSMVKLALVHRVDLASRKRSTSRARWRKLSTNSRSASALKVARLFEDFLPKAERLEAEENGELVDE
jgi:hypothetical protein